MIRPKITLNKLTFSLVILGVISLFGISHFIDMSGLVMKNMTATALLSEGDDSSVDLSPFEQVDSEASITDEIIPSNEPEPEVAESEQEGSLSVLDASDDQISITTDISTDTSDQTETTSSTTDQTSTTTDDQVATTTEDQTSTTTDDQIVTITATSTLAEEAPEPEEAIDPSPVVRSISSPILEGTFRSGVIPIMVVFNESVVVSGTPQLTLLTGDPQTTAVDLKFARGDRLYFLYHIVSGNSASPLNYPSSSALRLNGGSIRDSAGNNADLTLPNSGSVGSLTRTSQIIIDTSPADDI